MELFNSDIAAASARQSKKSDKSADPSPIEVMTEGFMKLDGERLTIKYFEPAQFEMEQCELAVRYFARRGAYGEVAHNENGINRAWASEDDLDIMKRIPPLAKVVGGTANADDATE